MTIRRLSGSVALVVVLLFGILSYGANDARDEDPRLIASGPHFVIHQFNGFVKRGLVESVIRSGIVISHTNLKSGEMKWLVTTGIHSIPTRRISYSITRLVGLIDDENHLFIVVYRSGRIFTESNRPPFDPNPKKGHYSLQVFSKKEGNEMYSYRFTNFDLFPRVVPQETLEAGVLKRTKEGYQVFDSVFRIDKSGKVIREEGSFQQYAPADADKPCR
jgi:hypothetical protein